MQKALVFTFLCLLLAAPAMAGPLTSIAINEIRIDQPGGDADEYFELFGEPGNAPLSGLTYVVIGDGTGGSGVVEAAIDLGSDFLPTDGFFVVAEDAMLPNGTSPDLTTTLDFENDDNVTHLLVDGFTGSVGDDLDTNDDCSLDTTPWTSVVDGVAMIKEANPPSGTECHYGTDLGLPIVGPTVPDGFVPAQIGRNPDATGMWEIGEFDPADGTDSPGMSNVGVIPVELQTFSVD